MNPTPKSSGGSQSTETEPSARKIPWMWIAIGAASAITVYLSSTFSWFKQNEHVAVWLEGVALVLIFGLDLLSRNEGREETKAQLKALTDQAEATEKAAVEAKKSSDILASLHQPLIGIASTTIADRNTRKWRIPIVVKNFG